MPRNFLALPTCASQPLNKATTAPVGMGPCRRSQVLKSSRVSSESGFKAARCRISTITSGAIRFSIGIRSALSRLVQCRGASRCVPICSFKCHRKIFHFSFPSLLTCSSESGSFQGDGKSGLSAWVRSITLRYEICCDSAALASDGPDATVQAAIPRRRSIERRETSSASLRVQRGRHINSEANAEDLLPLQTLFSIAPEQSPSISRFWGQTANRECRHRLRECRY